MDEPSPQVLRAATALAAQLRTALSNEAVIEQAIGVLRSRGSSAEGALTTLRTTSEGEHVGLVIVAHRVLAEAIRRSSAPPPQN
jgi:AmiR/NasT family two-component response regulator